MILTLLSIDYEARQDPRAPSNLLALQGEAHANRRRIWNRGMSRDSLKEYEEIISTRANQLANKLAEKGKAGESIDLSAWITYFTYAIYLPVRFNRDIARSLDLILWVTWRTYLYAHFRTIF